jgi:hypothetical protein
MMIRESAAATALFATLLALCAPATAGKIQSTLISFFSIFESLFKRKLVTDC